LAEASVALNDAIKSRALALEQSGFKALDALHLACAEAAGAERFLACDDRLIRRYSSQMIVESPVTFTTSLTGNPDYDTWSTTPRGSGSLRRLSANSAHAVDKVALLVARIDHKGDETEPDDGHVAWRNFRKMEVRLIADAGRDFRFWF